MNPVLKPAVNREKHVRAFRERSETRWAAEHFPTFILFFNKKKDNIHGFYLWFQGVSSHNFLASFLGPQKSLQQGWIPSCHRS